MALNLNYQPVSLVDTSTLTNEEWLQWRKKGIGGSDVAAALNLSPYRTMRDLYYDKIGVEAVEPGEDMRGPFFSPRTATAFFSFGPMILQSCLLYTSDAADD